jgi:hypothetical protein
LGSAFWICGDCNSASVMARMNSEKC